MTDSAQHVFHVLSLPRRDADRAEARGTVRVGHVETGDTLWYVTPSGERHEVRVLSVHSGERHLKLELGGTRESLESLEGGYYLYGG